MLRKRNTIQLLNIKVSKFIIILIIILFFLVESNINIFPKPQNNLKESPFSDNLNELSSNFVNKSIIIKGEGKGKLQGKFSKKSFKIHKTFFELSEEFFLEKSTEVSLTIIYNLQKLDKRRNKRRYIFEIS